MRQLFRSVIGVPRNVFSVSKRSFAKETKKPFDPPPGEPSNNSRNAFVIGAIGMVGVVYLFMTERNDYGISWYADQEIDESKMPVARPDAK
jgi:hypothetical protein